LEIRFVRIALGQFNATLGDLSGNVAKMKEMWARAAAAGAGLVLFPELAVCGYPPEDLVYKKQFVRDNRAALEELAAAIGGSTAHTRGQNDPDTTAAPGGSLPVSERGRDARDTAAVVGFVEGAGEDLYNSAAVIQQGRITAIYRKTLLPNTSVFDEQRYFRPGGRPLVVEIEGLRVAVTICQDLWDSAWLGGFLAGQGRIDLLLNLSASPFHVNKIVQRCAVVAEGARRFDGAVAYCNLVGGQDELVFDGRSILADSTGRTVTKAKAFEEDLLIADVECSPAAPGWEKKTTPEGGGATRVDTPRVQVRPLSPPAPQPQDEVDEIYGALVLGTRDYTRKNGFRQVLLGMSGGIDSAVTAAIAAAALGPENVLCVTMPSRFNSPETIADAKRAADNLGCPLLAIPIEPILKSFHGSLQADPRWNDQGLAYENLQARIRGMILMSLSNQIGALVLTTGNKSEVSVGYSTLYGDTAGGFSVIKDVLKTMVYRLAERINARAGREVMPVSVIRRVPTAELRPNQKDSDSLPEYDLLDRIITGYVEQDRSARDLVESGLPAREVERVIRMIDRNEYKRRQSPPGVRITAKAFGKDRRLPITNRYTTIINDRQHEIRSPK